MRLLTILFLTFLIPSLAFSLSYKVIAVVNGESISNIQLKDRVNLIINSAGMPNNNEVREKVTKEAVEVLINETLQNQEAKSKGIEITQDELDKAISDLEMKNGIEKGGFKKFITSKGVSYNSTIDQIKAGVQWKKTLSRFLRSQILITDKEIAEKQKTLQNIKKQVLVNISEIVIPREFEDNSSTYELLDKIISTVNSGERNFGDLALKYSVGKTASRGGQVGWIEEDKIMEPIKSEVKKTKTGKISNPIFVDNLYVVIQVNERKIIDPANDKNSIRDRLFAEKMEGQSKRYIKELRQKALIERKYNNVSELLK
ncbi:MAG: peptidylprolyl isomerase [Rickettsiales bacterium]|nr:peptidylprolyl isomerase [Rickettsiales bacterium]